jgi:hypothetical protein
VTDPGSRLAEELRLLVDAVAERAGPWLDRVAASSHEEHAAAQPGSGVCAWCPLCALLAVIRGEPSELATRGLDRLADLVALLRAVLADRWEPGVPHMPGFKPAPGRPADTGAPAGSRPPAGSGTPTDDRVPADPRVQRIPVRRKGDG